MQARRTIGTRTAYNNAIAEGSLLGRKVHSQEDQDRLLEHLERYVKTVVRFYNLACFVVAQGGPPVVGRPS